MRFDALRWAIALSVVSAFGCGDDGLKNVQLVRVRMLASGDAGCATGGTAIDSGIDSDQSGTLDDAEVQNTQTICNGLQGDVLVRTTPIEDGSSACANGGVRIESGNDDGSGGGAAGNGVLEDGEVDATTVVCSDSIVNLPDVTPPSGSPGVATIDTHGGDGTVGGGGAGGDLDLGTDEDVGTGSVLVFATGTAATAITVPTTTAFPGPHPVTIATSQSVAACPGPLPAAGTVCMQGGNLARANASGYDTVTSLTVPEGVTLTVDAGALSTIAIGFGYDLSVAGTIRVVGAGLDTPSLELSANKIRIETSGAVDLTSTTGAPGDLVLRAFTTLIALGRLDVDGGTVATVGRTGGDIDLDADAVYLAGTLEASGGAGSASSPGGNGGTVEVRADRRVVQSTATITANGGAGAPSGVGGSVAFIAGDSGPIIGGRVAKGNTTVTAVHIVNAGAISANGGTAPAGCNASCTGGNGGDIALTTYRGDLRSSAALSVIGGSALGAFSGGQGGNITLDNRTASNEPGRTTNVDVSGDLLAYAGSGASGPEGGDIIIHGTSAMGVVRLYGYGLIRLNGGNGVSGGGEGGDVQFYRYYGGANYFYEPLTVQIHTPIESIGGTSSAAYGGRGGDVDILTSATQIAPELISTTLPGTRLVGTITLTGGGGADPSMTGGGSGSGGGVSIVGRQAISVEGAVSASAPATADGSGGSGGSVVLTSHRDPVSVSGAIALRGANARSGGSGGNVAILGSVVACEGPIDVSGGNSSASMTQGGFGGAVSIESESGTSTVGTVTRAGGTGTPAGTLGQLTIDTIAQP